MVVTRLDESHLMPLHWQNVVVGDQSEGGGVRDFRRFDITAASSAVTAVKDKKKKRERVEREVRVFIFG